MVCRNIVVNLRRLVLLEVVVGLFVSSAHLSAQTVPPLTLAWNPSPSADVTSYVVRYGTASGVYSVVTNVGNRTSASVTGLQAGQTYYLAVTARTDAGIESPPSNQATYQATTTSVPVVVLTAPVAGTSYQSPANLNLTASVTANGHTITKIQFLNGTSLLGEDASAPYSYTWNGVATGSYTLSARAVYGSGSTVNSSTANVVVTNPPVVVTNQPPANGLTFEAIGGVITAPFTISGGTISQIVDTGLAGGGRAVYVFNVATAGNYTIAANVDAPSLAQNSFFVNVDAEPTDPYMVWHVPVTSGLQSRTVSWQGNGTVDSSQFAPKIFALTAGTHQLIIRGRESNVRLGTIRLTPATVITPPTITLTSPTSGANYGSPATVNFTATVTANGNTITKVQFFNGSVLLGEDTSSPYGFAWSSVSPGTYDLKARAVYNSGSTIDSATATVVVAALPAPWQTVDIGSTGLSGTATQSNGIYTVRGAGRITGTSDGFRFVYQPLSADGEIRARLNSVQASNTNGCFGVMIRETLTPGSEYAFMGVAPDLKFRWQRRSSTAGTTSTTVSTAAPLPDVWVRVVRSGSTLTGYKSTDGANWTLVNSRNISMAANIYVGFAVASGSTNFLSTVTFANGSVVP